MMNSGFGVTTGKTITAVIEGDNFWPDLPLSEFMENYRLPAEYAENLIMDHVLLAKLWAVKELASFPRKYQGQKLKDIPYQGIADGCHLLFKRAVFCRAKALLLEQFATIERREAARNDAKEAPETKQTFFEEAHRAIAMLLDKPFVSCEAV